MPGPGVSLGSFIGRREVPWKLFTKLEGILELKYTPVLLIAKLLEYFAGPGEALGSSSNRDDFPILEHIEPLYLELK